MLCVISGQLFLTPSQFGIQSDFETDIFHLTYNWNRSILGVEVAVIGVFLRTLFCTKIKK